MEERENKKPEGEQKIKSRTGHHTESRPEWQTRKEIRLTDLVFALRKRLVLLIICTIVGLAAGVCLSIASYMKGEINKQYAITTAIAVTSQNKDGLFTARSSSNPDSSDIYLAEKMVDSVIFVMKSDTTIDAAIKRLDLIGIASKDIANNLELSQYNDTQVIQITLYWRSAQEGIEILDAINEVSPDILIKTLKIGGVSVIDKPKAKYLIGGNINAVMWLYCMMLGFMLGCGFAVIEMLIRPTLVNTRDMEKLFSLEILGEIPNRKKYFRKKRNLLIHDDEDEYNADILDNYSSLAHILKSRIKDRTHTCVYVTSASQNEGKTTVTSRLAVQLSELGMKVLMIDFDTRNPKLGGLFLNKVEYGHSINALYRGETTREDAITHLTGRLDILPSILEKSPFMFDADLIDMITELKKDYDVTLIDTAPVGQVADTMGLNHLADVALMVVRFDGAGIEVIRDALGRLDKSGTSIIGCVVNGVKRLGHRGHYGYGYSYGRGYGRGYGAYGRYAGSSHRKRKSDHEKEWEQWEKEHLKADDKKDTEKKQ